MFEDIMKKAGLSQIQAETLDFLLRNGESKAIEIAKNTPLSRGVAYKALDELLELGLVEKIEKPNQVARFRPEHPGKLEELFIEKERQKRRERKEFEDLMPELISAFNLANHKPGVKFLEGEDGIRIALWDTLRNTDEIYTFVDVRATEENLAELNAEYAKKREQMGIRKKIITIDTPESREFFRDFKDETTQVRFIQQEYRPFRTGMQIYSNKVSYQTLGKENKVAVIIEDSNIAGMQKLFFEFVWEKLARI